MAKFPLTTSRSNVRLLLGERCALIEGFPYARLNTPPAVSVFATCRDGLLRTVGLSVLLASDDDRLEDWDAQRVQAFSHLLDPLVECQEASAWGKFNLIQLHRNEADSARHKCFQVRGRAAEVAFCGNSTAAVAAVISDRLGTNKLHFQTLSNECSADIEAHIGRDGCGRRRVNQEWSLEVRGDAIKKSEGLHEVVCDLLNPYLIVDGSDHDELDRIRANWMQQRGLKAKLAVIEQRSGIAGAAFYNCNGLHRSAPLTGLITLAIIQREVPWLQDLLGKGVIQTPHSVEEVPTIRYVSNSVVHVEMPELSVELHDLHYHLKPCDV